MQRRYRFAMAVLTLAGAAACGQQAQQPSEDLRRDLDKVASSGIELAPNGAGTQVMSAIEQGPAGTVKTATPQMRATPKPSAPRTKAPAAVAPAPAVAEAPQPQPEVKAVEQPAPQPVVAEQPVAVEPVDRAPAAQRPAPLPIPSTQRAPRGGWKTTGDVIRNAPFPINP